MAKKVRVVFVGVGAMGQCAHLRNYRSIDDCEVVALAELRPKLARRVAQRYEIPRIYQGYEEMLEKETFDGIVASQPFDRHGVLLPDLVRAGRPIFVEKPLASTVEAGEKILRCLEETEAWIMVGYHKRSDPAVMYARGEVDRLRESAELGALKYVRIVMPSGDWAANGFQEFIDEGEPLPELEREPPPTDMEAEGFRHYLSFVNYYIHQVNLLRHFLCEPYRVRYADPAGVLFVGESESGVPCTIEMTPYRTTVDWQESVLIAFEKGYVKVELPAPLARNRAGRVEVLCDPGHGKTPLAVSPHLPWVDAMQQQAMNFLAAVRGERKPMCDAREALEDLKVAREHLRLWKGC